MTPDLFVDAASPRPVIPGLSRTWDRTPQNHRLFVVPKKLASDESAYENPWIAFDVPASPSAGRAFESLQSGVVTPEGLRSDDAGVRLFRAMFLLAASEAIAALLIYAMVRIF